MDNTISHSPIRKTEVEPEKMTFDQAIRKLIDGEKITRLGWEDKRFFCLLDSGILSLHKAGEANDVLHPWIVNDGDLLAIDWVVL